MHCRRYLIPMLGHFRLDQLSGLHVQTALNTAYEKDELSPTTVKVINATLKTALTSAKRWGLNYVEGNAAKDATPPRQVKFKPKPLMPDEGIRLLNVVVDHRYEATFYLGLLEGLRRGEVAALQWPDVHFALGTLTVKGALQRVTGEGAVLIGVKSEASDDTIPMLPVVADALRRRRERQEQERRESGKNWKQDEQFVFTSRDGHRIMPEELLRELREVLPLAGLPEIRFHDLRHSCAKTLRKLGVDIKTIQLILRHATSQITMDLYLKGDGFDPEVLAATQKLNDLFERELLAAGSAKAVRRTVRSALGEMIQ